jgi:hypothetical protein
VLSNGEQLQPLLLIAEDVRPRRASYLIELRRARDHRDKVFRTMYLSDDRCALEKVSRRH